MAAQVLRVRGAGECTGRKGGRRGAGWLDLLLIAGIALMSLTGCGGPRVPDNAPDVLAFEIYFNNDNLGGDATACDAVFPVARSAATGTAVEAALNALFRGPTPAERAQGYRSFFSQSTAGLLRRVTVANSTAYVDLHDLRRELSGVSSSCGSAEFFSQIRHTLRQFPGIERVIFAVEGQPGVFYDWMELECGPGNDNCDPAPFASP